MEEIDFVIPWVDGSDPQWLQIFKQYRCESDLEDVGELRYRDWDTLQYWFRGVEKYAPWVRKIHFITYGHLPKWLNISHPKLHIVNHQDYIPCHYLPTFSSHPIELNLYRIDGLADKFVYFNDDTFLIKEASPERFFRGGLPCDIARLSVIQNSSIDHIILNDLSVIRRHFLPHKVIFSQLSQWFNFSYGLSDMSKTLTLLPWCMFTGFKDTHMPQPFLKSTFELLWDKEFEILDRTSKSKFRSITNVNQYLMRYWTLVEGKFYPISSKDCNLYNLGEHTIENIVDEISRQKYRLICINDSDDVKSFNSIKDKLKSGFERILGIKSSYEL